HVAIAADATLLALGGASWPRLGSDGDWVAPLTNAGIPIAPLQAANCGVRVAWSDVLRQRFAGQPLKRLALSCAGHTERGEAVITEAGLEGGAIYALSAAIRGMLATGGAVLLHIDLRPDMAAADLQQRLSTPRARQSLANFLRKAAHLSPV